MKNVYTKALYAVAIFCLSIVCLACGGTKTLSEKLDRLPGRAVLIADAKAQGITLSAMEALYPNGLPFAGDSVPAGYVQEWRGFVQGLARALRDSGMVWNEPYYLWGRAYFAPDGKVDHFFYHWTDKTGNRPTADWQARFGRVAEAYVASFRFGYSMNRRFAQCGGVLLQPAQ